jgi:hypothetical protein
MPEGDEQREDTTLAIFMAIAVVEAFVNIFFRVVVSEPDYAVHEGRLLDDLRRRKSLDYKLRNWPTTILGGEFNLSSGVGTEFVALKERRNGLAHFTSSHQSVTLPGFVIQGLAGTSIYDDLTAADAVQALAIAEAVVQEVFRLRGIPKGRLGGAMHLWTGRVR